MTLHRFGDLTEGTLENGLRVLIREIHTAPVVSLGMFYGVGSYDERPAMTGVSHWIEHLMFKGTQQMPQQEFMARIRRHGGSLNAQTTPDYTCYYETLPKEHLRWAIEVEADRMRNSSRDRDAFEQERQVILAELDGFENTPQYHLRRAVQSAAYQVHPYRNPVIGWRNDIQHLPYEALLSHYELYYTPGNALLVVAGDVVPDSIVDLLEDTFGGFPDLHSPPRLRVVEPPQQGQRSVRLRRPVRASYVSLAYHIPPFGHEDAFPLRVLEAVLGYGRGGRLHQRLVDTQLTTSAAVSLFLPHDSGLMFLGATVPEEQNSERAESALLDVIHGVQQEGITEEERLRAIRQREMGFLYAQDSVSYHTRQLGAYAMLGSYRYHLRYLDYLAEVTCDDVQRVAQTYLVRENSTVGWQILGSANVSVTVPAGIRRLTESRVDPLSQAPLIYLPTASRERVYHQLPNGLRVILQRSAASPIVEVQIRIRIGGNPEPAGLAGVSTLTAHLLQKGTQTRTAQRIAEETEHLGAQLQVQGSVDAVSASLTMLSCDLASTLPVLADVLQNPTFPRREVRKQRDRIRARLREERGWPTSQAYRAFYSMVYPEGHPYRYTMGVDQTSIENIRVTHLRDFHRRYYRPERATLVLVANVDTTQALELIEACFGNWQGNETPTVEQIPKVAPPTRIQSTHIAIPGKSQVEVLLGHIGIARRNPDYHRLMLMNHILSGFGGRLYQRIREDLGLAYGVCSSFAASLGEGPFMVHLGTAPRQVEIAVYNVLDEIRQIQQKCVEPDELDLARCSLMGRFAISMQTHAGIASALLTTAFYGLEASYLDDYRQYYEAVTPGEIQDVARRYLYPDGYSLAVAGPQAV